MRFSISLTIFLLLSLYHLSAQNSPERLATPEAEFELMRSLAQEKHYSEAKLIGKRILEENPEYFDVSVYLARIYGWESSFDSAYAVLEGVLALDDSHLEALGTRMDLAYWENDWDKLLEYSQQALDVDSTSSAFKEKYLLAKQHLRGNPSTAEVFVFYSLDHFRLPYTRNWHMLTAGGNIPFRMGILSPYVNAGYQSSSNDPSTDMQVNLDAYLNLGKKNYGMAGYGISPDGLVNYLPRHRAALEVWQVLPKGFAISAGLRYFYWNQHFTYFTISEEKYAGNYWFSFRSYIFFKDYGVSGSYYLGARRYFADKFNYVGLTLGVGTAPDEPILVVSDLERLHALSARFDFSKQIRQNLRLNLMAGYAYEEYSVNEKRHRIDLRAGLFIRLKR